MLDLRLKRLSERQCEQSQVVMAVAERVRRDDATIINLYKQVSDMAEINAELRARSTHMEYELLTEVRKLNRDVDTMKFRYGTGEYTDRFRYIACSP